MSYEAKVVLKLLVFGLLSSFILGVGYFFFVVIKDYNELRHDDLRQMSHLDNINPKNHIRPVRADEITGYDALRHKDVAMSRRDQENLQYVMGRGTQHEGAYYPGAVEPEPASSSAMAAGVAGLGGVMVFGVFGILAFKLMGSMGDEEVEFVEVGALENGDVPEETPR